MKDSHGQKEDSRSSEKLLVSISLDYLKRYPASIYKTLPIHLLHNDKGHTITLPQLLNVSLEGTAETIAQRLEIPDSTAAHNRAIALEFVRRKYNLPTPPLRLDKTSNAKLEKIETEYTDYEQYRKLICSWSYEQEHTFLRRLTVVSKNGNTVPFLDLLRKYYGWDIARQPSRLIAAELGKTIYDIHKIWDGGKLLLNTVTGAEFTSDHSISGYEFLDVSLLKLDRYHMAQEYLNRLNKKLLPIERFALVQYLNGLKHTEIMKAAQRLMSADSNTFKTISYGTIPTFLTQVFEMRTDKNIFQKLWIADESRKLLSEKDIEISTKMMLLHIASGLPFKEAAKFEGMSTEMASKRLREVGIETNPTRTISIRKRRLLGQREELLQAVYLLNCNWPEKQHDLRILTVLANHEDISFTETGKQIGISDIQVALSVARVRTILRREMYTLGEENERAKNYPK